MSETKKTEKNVKAEGEAAVSEKAETAKKAKTAAVNAKVEAAEKAEMETSAESEMDQEEKNAASESVVYVGPSIHGVVQPNTVFKNGLSEAVKRKVKKIPLLREMFVPVDDLGKVRQDLKKKESAIRACYDSVTVLLTEEKEGGNVC